MSQSSPLRLHPPTATNGEHGCSRCRFHISEAVMDLMTIDGGGFGYDDDGWRRFWNRDVVLYKKVVRYCIMMH
ncbi:hypothetical protein Tco_1383478 [Tanacetum coccineum]